MVNILARILDLKQNFNGCADPMITADCNFIQFLGPDFGFWLVYTLIDHKMTSKNVQNSSGSLPSFGHFMALFYGL